AGDGDWPGPAIFPAPPRNDARRDGRCQTGGHFLSRTRPGGDSRTGAILVPTLRVGTSSSDAPRRPGTPLRGATEGRGASEKPVTTQSVVTRGLGSPPRRPGYASLTRHMTTPAALFLGLRLQVGGQLPEVAP